MPAIETQCPHAGCGYSNRPDAMYCAHCGAELPSRIAGRVGEERPAILWVGLCVLGLIVIIQILSGLVNGNVSLLVSAAMSAILWFGLYLGHRWAFVLTIVFVLLGVVVAFMRDPNLGMLTLVFDGFVLVPVLMSRAYFWGRAA